MCLREKLTAAAADFPHAVFALLHEYETARDLGGVRERDEILVWIRDQDCPVCFHQVAQVHVDLLQVG